MSDENGRIHLSPPHMSGNEQSYIQAAFDSNWVAPLGPNVDRFEAEMAAYLGVKGAVALSSGTAAIHLALRLLGVGRGDRVFCSSLTFIASANPVLYQGADPVFIDSDWATWTMSPAALEQALADADRDGKLPKAVIVVDLYGQSADMDRLVALCDRYGVAVIHDAAASLGTTYKGRKSGTSGHFGIYSFNGNKIITTSGGGMLVSDDLTALDKARFWATQAKDDSPHYQHSELGYNYRMSNILAGIGRAQLQMLDQRVSQRQAVFARYAEAFADVDGIAMMPEAAYGRSNRWLTALTVDAGVFGASAGELIAALERENIEARPVWKPLHLQPLFVGAAFYAHREGEGAGTHAGEGDEVRMRDGAYGRGGKVNEYGSVSEAIFVSGLCLPSGSNLSEADQQRVIRCIKKVKGARHLPNHVE